MPCIYSIPKNEYRHCELCTAAYCDERPKEQETISSTGFELSGNPYENDIVRMKARELYGVGSIFDEERRGFIKGAEWMQREQGMAILTLLGCGIELRGKKVIEATVEWMKKHSHDYSFMGEQCIEDYVHAMEEITKTPSANP